MRLALAALLSLTAGAAHAEDGIVGFFQHVFGGSAGQQSASLPRFDPDSPPLTVRAHPRRHVATVPRMTPEELKNVTIYTDRTLSRGDAVMTAKGMRIFNGSGAGPYTDDDFVALSEGKVSPVLRNELTAMDLASRPELAHN